MPSYDYNLIFEDNWAGHMSIVTICFATELLPIVVAIEATVLILTDSFLGSILTPRCSISDIFRFVFDRLFDCLFLIYFLASTKEWFQFSISEFYFIFLKERNLD